MIHTFSATSEEPVWASWLDRLGGDPTGDTVEMAFLAEPPTEASPEEADWNPATWVTITAPEPDQYKASCLVGPGQVELDAGTWYVWVRVTTSGGTPVKHSGRIQVTP